MEEDIRIFRDYLKDAFIKTIGDPDPNDNPLDDPNMITSFVSVHKGVEYAYENVDMVTLKSVLEDKLAEHNEIKA
jgi:hypothetical protein